MGQEKVRLKKVQEYVIYGFICMLNMLDFISNMKQLKGLNQSNETICVARQPFLFQWDKYI